MQIFNTGAHGPGGAASGQATVPSTVSILPSTADEKGGGLRMESTNLVRLVGSE